MSELVQQAWKAKNYARAIDKSRSWLLALPPELQPYSMKFGRNRFFTEHPQDFLKRLAQHLKAA